MHEPYLKRMGTLLRTHQPRHDIYTLFSDCMEEMAIAISNSVDLAQREQREARYLDIMRRYDRPVIETFPQIMAELTLALECGLRDVLGALFHAIELHNKARGQYFTPYPLCRTMADIVVGDGDTVRRLIEQRGFLTAMEPACGSGAMVIGLAEALRTHGINHQRHLHVTAIDIDPRAIHMAYCQLSLLHIPAHLIVGNSLSLETREHWFTPAHILGGWSARLRAVRTDEETFAIASPPPLSSGPMPTATDDTASSAAPASSRRDPPKQLSLF